MNVPFVRPDIGEAEIAAVSRVLRSGWITTGPETKAFESDLAAFLGRPKVACLASQTFAQEMVLRLLGVGPGDEVIVPAYTYTASASIVCHVGAKLILVDAVAGGTQMDPEKLAAALSPRTKAIIPVDLAGIPCDYDDLLALAETGRATFRAANAYQEALGRPAVLADTAHALGASYKGVRCGAVADFSSFSFHAVKNLTTAEGGAVAWRNLPGIEDEAIYVRLMLQSLHGQTKDALSKTQAGSWEYDITEPLYKGNMTDLHAALGRAQLRRYEAMLKRRETIVRIYDEACRDLPLTPLRHFAADRQSSYHLYILRLDAGREDLRNAFIRRMAELGVSCNVHYKPLPLLTAYRSLGFRPEAFPEAMAYYSGALTLPLYSSQTDEEVEAVVTALRQSARELL